MSDEILFFDKTRDLDLLKAKTSIDGALCKMLIANDAAAATGFAAMFTSFTLTLLAFYRNSHKIAIDDMTNKEKACLAEIEKTVLAL